MKKYEALFNTPPFSGDNWIEISIDKIKNPENIDKYIEEGFLRVKEEKVSTISTARKLVDKTYGTEGYDITKFNMSLSNAVEFMEDFAEQYHQEKMKKLKVKAESFMTESWELMIDNNDEEVDEKSYHFGRYRALEDLGF